MYCKKCGQAESATVSIKQHILLHKLVDQELASRSQIEHSRVFNEDFSVVLSRSNTGPRRLRIIVADDGMYIIRYLNRHNQILKGLHFYDFEGFCVFVEAEVKRLNRKN